MKKLKLWPLPIHKSFFKIVLSWFISVVMIKYPNKRQLKREKVHLSSLFLGRQGSRNVKPYSHTQKHREMKFLSAHLLACALIAVSPLTPLRLLDQKWCAPAGWIKTLSRGPPDQTETLPRWFQAVSSWKSTVAKVFTDCVQVPGSITDREECWVHSQLLPTVHTAELMDYIEHICSWTFPHHFSQILDHTNCCLNTLGLNLLALSYIGLFPSMNILKIF